MEITSYSDFRRNLKSHLDALCASNAPLYVTRSKGDDIVVISKSEYMSIQETIYLMSNPRNAQRLAESLDEYQKREN